MEWGENHFSIIDYVVVAGTLLGSLGIGLFFAFQKQTTDDLLVGGRNMGPFPIACSMMVTYLSAISILGTPSEVYYHGIQMYVMNLMGIIIVPLSAFILVPVFYPMKLTSVYSYLELRFDSLLCRWMGAFLAMCQLLFVMGVILFAPAIPVQHIMGIPVWASVVGIGLCGTAYTAVGGLKAVVWTDVFQLAIILISMVAILAKGFVSAGGIVNAFKISAEHDRLNLFDFAVDPFMRHNTLNFFVGFGFTTFCMIATHQPQVQRYSSLPSEKAAISALLYSIPLNVFTNVLFYLTGIAIFATYATCDPRKSGKISRNDEIVPFFIVKELIFIPGILGLFISCIFSAVLSTVSSALNSAAAITWEDFLSKMPVLSHVTDKAKANVTRALAASYGLIIIGFAFLASDLGPVLPLTISIVGATAGPLGAIFIIGLFFPFANKYGANTGMAVGISTMFYYSYKSFSQGMQHIPLPTSTEGCSHEFTLKNQTISVHDTDWPEKIFTLSYLLLPFVGAVITMTVSLVVSILTGGFCSAKNVRAEYLHPWVRRCCSVSRRRSVSLRASVIRANSNYADRLNTEFSAESTPSFTYRSNPYKYSSVPTTSPTKLSTHQETVGESLLNARL